MTSAPRKFGPDWLGEKIVAGDLVIIDGGMGTELEARGVPMDKIAWSGTAALTHPDVVQAVHADYIAAGSEVIITNTFAAGRQVLEPAGFGDQCARINKVAVDCAKRARDESENLKVAVAGSMCPWVNPDTDYSQQLLADMFREQADLLTESGVDIIALEMCSHPVYSRLVAEAAVATGLPVWLGLSCKRDHASGTVVGFGPPHVDFRELIVELADIGASVMNVMHSSIDDTTEGLSVLKQIWQGPVGVYPESGYFVMPNWQFVDIIETDALVNRARGWVDNGVQILGGCCGLGVPHIRALRAAFRRDE